MPMILPFHDVVSVCWCNVPDPGSKYVHQIVLSSFFIIPSILYHPHVVAFFSCSNSCSAAVYLRTESNIQASYFWLHLSSDDIVLH